MRPTRWVPAVTAAVMLLSACGGEPVRMERRWPVMGTFASAIVYHRRAVDAEAHLEEVRQVFADTEARMSNWSEESELTRLNRTAWPDPVSVDDPDLFRCIRIALEYAELSEGAFDPTVGPLMTLWGFRPRQPRVPTQAEIEETLESVGWEKVLIEESTRQVAFRRPGMELDLGGIAKGYALDIAARRFARIGAVAGLLDLGGGVYAWREPPGEDGWTVGLRDPFDPQGLMGSVRMSNRAAATSANYENAFTVDGVTYGHLIDPRTGRPGTTDVVAATAFADSGVDADALSTTLMQVGSLHAAPLLNRLRRTEAILVVEGPDGPSVLASASLAGRLQLDPEFAEAHGGAPRFILPPTSLDAERKVEPASRIPLSDLLD